MLAAHRALRERGAHGEEQGDRRDRARRLHFLAPRIARQTFCGVAGMAVSRTPMPASASTMALTTAAGAGGGGPSPPGLVSGGVGGGRKFPDPALEGGRGSR